jgi:hypothetical protein
MFATHKDKVNSTTEKGYQLSTGGFNCNCEDFVAEGQFLNDAHIIVITAPKVFSVFNTVPGYTFFSQHHFFSELRGPPAIV